MQSYYHHFGDFARDTFDLTLVEFGIYRGLIDLYYCTETPLTNDLRVLASSSRCDKGPYRRSLEMVLNRFFYKGPDGLWHHKRIDRDLERWHLATLKGLGYKQFRKLSMERGRQNRKAMFEALEAAGCTMHRHSSNLTLIAMIQKLGIPDPCNHMPIKIGNQPASAKDFECQNEKLEQLNNHLSIVKPLLPNADLNTQNPIFNKAGAGCTTARRDAADAAVDPLVEAKTANTYFDDEDKAIKAIAERVEALGVRHVVRQDPRLRLLVQAGFSADDFAGRVAIAQVRGQKWSGMLSEMINEVQKAQQGHQSAAG